MELTEKERKIITLLLIICLLNLFSCYSRTLVKKPNDIRKIDLSTYSKIKVKTSDGNYYLFKEGSLSADEFVGIKKNGDSVRLNINDVSYFDLRRFQTTLTIILVTIVVGGGIFLACLPWGLH